MPRALPPLRKRYGLRTRSARRVTTPFPLRQRRADPLGNWTESRTLKGPFAGFADRALGITTCLTEPFGGLAAPLWPRRGKHSGPNGSGLRALSNAF